MKIFLIGYMGCGKSTIGKELAEKIKSDFIDFDCYVEKETGKTITEIFESEGEEKFRALEHTCLKKLLTKENAVISLGGGTPCFHNNIHLINKNGISVYLEMSIDTLVKRLSKAKNKRPLIRDLNEIDLRYFIEANLEKRLPFYRQAKYCIKAENRNVGELTEQLVQLIKD